MVESQIKDEKYFDGNKVYHFLEKEVLLPS